ncbi:MAG: hypothetical protein K6C11_02520 [Bacilli bacterium]|nr:hypothetical protein [Bacilli bacterium]
MRRGSISWHEGAASRFNEPDSFYEFKYDNLNNKIFDLLGRIDHLKRNIQEDTYDVVRAINRISNYYGSVTDYDEYLNDMKQVLMIRNNDLIDTTSNVAKNIRSSVSKLASKDAKLMRDLELLEQMLRK